jgi:hypothetical protein
MLKSTIGKEVTKLLVTIVTVVLVAGALVITIPYQNHIANAAPSVKDISVTDEGFGIFTCSPSRSTDSGSQSGAGAAGGIEIDATVDKITGKVTGTWKIVDDFGAFASGDITGGQMEADSFRLSGVETFTSFHEDICSPTPLPVTFTGQCGNDVAIAVSLQGERPQPDMSQTQTATFTGVGISCTK